MKNFTLMILVSLLSFYGYSQEPGLPREGFETGWTLAPTAAAGTNWFTMQNNVSTAVTWVQGLPNSPLAQPAYEGERAAFLARQNVIDGTPWPEDYLVTPEFEVPQNPELHFYSRLTLPDDQGSIYKIFIINITETPNADLNSPTSYTEIKSWTELEINPSQLQYAHKIVSIPSDYIGARVRIAFMMTGDDMDRWLIDNVEVVKKCERPTELEAINLKMHSADLNWENPSGAEKWDIEIIPDSANPTGVPTTTYTGTLPYHIDNLNEDTCYKFYVRAVCQDGGKSDWVGATYFCTERLGDSCSDPLPVTALPFTDTNDTTVFADNYKGIAGTNCNTEEWEDYLKGNDVVYKYTATFTGEINIDLANIAKNAGIFIYNSCDDIGVNCITGGNSGDAGNNVAIDGFNVTNGEDYYIVISTAILPSTPYILTIQAVACDEPVGLPVTEIGMTSAKFSWTNATGANSWQIVVQNAGIGVPQGTGETVADNTNYLRDDLQASTAYEYWVRADCNNGTFSAWAGPYYFNTTICEIADQCIYKFSMWGKWGTWEGHTMAVKQNGITIATLTGPNGENASDVLEVEIPICNTFPLELFWNPGGDFPWSAASIGASIKNSFGQEIFLKEPEQGIQNTTLFEIIADCEKPACLTPKGLTAANATQTTVDLSWNGPATGNWEYYIVKEGLPAPTDNSIGTSTTTNPTIGAGPLTESTNYEYYVRQRCENANSELSTWSKASKFSSSVCDPADKCDYTFILMSDYFPTGGWEGAYMTVSQNDTNVAILGPSFTEGMTKTVTIPLCPDIPFKIFWNFAGNSWEGGIGLKVINKFNQTIFEFPIGSTITNAFIYEGEVDCENPACLVPTGLTAFNGTMTSIDLKWDGPATGDWEYYIVDAGGAAPTQSTQGTYTSVNPVTAPLANPATNYEYYVRIICTDAGAPTSTWAGPYAMHSEVCNESEKCTYYFELTSKEGYAYGENTMTIYQSGVPVAVLGPNFTWESENPLYQMEEVKLCSGEEIKIVWNVEGYEENDKGLRVLSPYMEDIYTKPFGEGKQGDTLYTGLVSCDPPACLKPQNLSVSDVGLTQATLNWDEMGDASSWEVMVLPLGSPTPTTAGEQVTSHPFPWNHPLLPSTPYVFYVRVNCGTDGYSTWAGPFKFVTKIGNDECTAPIHLPVNSGTECVEFVSGTLTGSTGTEMMISCTSWIAQYDIWYEFTALEDKHVISLNNQSYVEATFVVYEGDSCGNLVELYCDDNYVGVVSNLTPGNKYLVQVYASWIRFPSMITSFDLCVSVPNAIKVDDTITPEDIVKNSLIPSTCANIQNISWSTGTDVGVNGIAYFEKSLTAFPLEEGVILTTGYASKAPGPHLDAKGDGEWAGDDQLFQYMDGLGLDPGSYHDATILEFDFTPLGNKIKFPFVFASEEYGSYQCSYSDAFAFFLTTDDGTGTPVTTNLAVVPETNSPVSVVTIRNHAFNEICESKNESYFDKYYGIDGNQPELATNFLSAPVNYKGNTIKMYAEGDVIPNQVYHIKLVIADRGDSNYDSAVFIGKFDIGNTDLGPDLTIENGEAFCLGDSYTIESGMDAGDYSFTWSKDGNVIAGETSSSLVVTATGNYTLVADLGGTCSTTDTIRVEFYPEIITGDPLQLTICDPDGFGTFNLSDNTAIIVGNSSNEFTVSYHTSEAKALANEEALPLTNYENTIQFEQVIYVRIVNTKGCVSIKSFSLIVQDLTPIFKVNDDFSICEGTTGTITATPIEPANYNPANVTYSWNLNGSLLPDTASSITASIAGVYEVTINNNGCVGTSSVTMAITPKPVSDELADVIVCAEYKLPVLSLNNNYYTGLGGTGKMLSAGDVITSTQTIYIYAESATTPGCTAESSFVATIIPTAIIATAQGCEGNDYTLEVLFDGDPTYSADNTVIEWTDSKGVIVGSQTKLIVTEIGIYTVTVTPDGGIECPVSDNVIVDATTCMIPRGISPNNDGKNDRFDLSSLKVKHLSIFNRYGKEVYKKDNYKNEFFGQGTHGDDLPTGTYFYMVEREGAESITGWLYINRNE